MQAAPVSASAFSSETATLIPEDFCTGLVSLSRFNASFDSLGQEYRRKILFGSDQVIP